MSQSKLPPNLSKGKSSRPRWHLLYYVLAGFDLLTVLVTLSLSHRIMSIYSDSVNENQRLAATISRFANLAESAGTVNAPGNDVFDSRDVPTERRRVSEARQLFDRQLAEIESAATADERAGRRVFDSVKLAEVRSKMNDMCAEAELIFSFFTANEPDKAGTRMATMDRKFAILNTAIASLQKDVRDTQQSLFAAELKQADSLRNYEYFLAGAILLMIGGVTVYGHRLARAIADAESQRLRAESEREALQAELVLSSRKAGMAEVATGVLHNVGNVLNSVCVSAKLVQDTTAQMRSPQLVKAAQMLMDTSQQQSELDAKTRQLHEYLVGLAGAIAKDHQMLNGELSHLAKGIDHIKEVIATQQAHAKNSTMLTVADPDEVFEEALRIVQASMDRHRVNVIRDFKGGEEVHIDKHKVLQILINLLTNAKKAMLDANIPQPTLTLRTRMDLLHRQVEFIVQDNGVGISQENLTKIFHHGFTTRVDGHGFGLHSSVNAAREMNGNLSAKSDGVGKGAAFTLALPMKYASTLRAAA